MRTATPTRRRSRGFTLIEMVVCVAIVAVLAAAARPMVELAARRAKESELRHALRTLRGAIDAYKQASDEGRIARAADASGYPANLAVLVEGVPQASASAASAVTAAAGSAESAKRLYFLRRLPRDPFAPASLSAAQTWALRSYESPPDAPRAGRDVFDVASRSPRVALDGTRLDQW
jgi:general secretion pathway protein G